MLEQLKLQLEKVESWLLSVEPPEGRLQTLLWTTARIIYALIRDIASGQLTMRAMSLVYTSILSLVPLLALSFSLLKAFNVQDKLSPVLYQFFEPMGEKGLEVYEKIFEFVDNLNVGLLGSLGLLMLIYTVMSMIQKIEEAFNSIWHAPGSRTLARRFSNYLTAVILGPILAVLTISLTAGTRSSGIVETLSGIEPFGSLFVLLSKLVPVMVIVTGFFFCYLFMPNARVKLKSAFIGALVAGIGWQAMSVAFGHFVVGSANYDAVYSGFAVGIVLLIWLYANWLIILLGSSISFYHQNGHYITQVPKEEASPELKHAIAIKVMVEVGRRYDEQTEPLSLNEIERLPGIPGTITRSVIQSLIRDDLLISAGDKSEQLAPARSTDRIMLSQIFHSVNTDPYRIVSYVSLGSKSTEYLDNLSDTIQGFVGNTSLRDIMQ